VTDTEDGNSTFAATLSAISGPLTAYGIGDQTASCSYTDAGGLTALASVTYAIVDTHGPTSSALGTSNGSSYTFGDWANHDVTVSLSGSDAGAGLKEIRYTTDGTTTPDATHGTVYSAPFSISSEGTTTLKYAAIDNAGNVETAHSASIRIDKHAPTINCGSADGTWHAANVSISCSASDSGSGLADAGDASFSLSTSVSDGTETSDAPSGSRDVFDVAGNVATAGPIGGNKIDRKAPTITDAGVQSGTTGSNGWYISAVTNRFTAADGGSGLSSSCAAAFPKDVSTGTSEGSSVSVGSGSCSDAVGNTNNGISGASFSVDLTDPSVSCGSADGNWHAADVSISCTASDGGSGLADAGDASFSLSTNVAAGTETSNASTGTHDVYDAAGRVTQAGPISGNRVDKKAPQKSSCDAADGQWHANNVTLHCVYTDGGSGPATQQVTLSTNVASGDEDSNAAASAGGAQACDTVNNCASSPADIGSNKIDRKAPVISCGSADSAWHATDQSVTCTATDNGSGLAHSADASFSLSTSVAANTETDSANTGSHSVADAVGNSDTAGPVGPFKIDKKAPTISDLGETSSADGSNGWYVSAVTNQFKASDDGSGLSSGCVALFPVNGSGETVRSVSSGTSEGSSVKIASGSCADAVGNVASSINSQAFKIDLSDPTIAFTGQSPAKNGAGWNNSTVTLSWSCSDSVSGAVASTVTQTVSTEGQNQGKTATCYDNAGRSASSTDGSVNIDKTAPSVVYTSANPAPNAAGWNNTDVVATFTATDTLSGFAGPSATKTGTSSTSGEGSTVTVGSPAFTDLAGNTVVAGKATSDPFKIDKTRPTVSVTGVTSGATYTLGSVPAAGCSTSDLLSGVKTSATVSISGGPVGSVTATCSGAEDNAGNTNSVSVTYNVVYNWTGFFQPVDNLPTLNSVKAGSAVPVKFSLSGNQGLNIFAAGYPTSNVAACDAGATEDVVEVTVTAGNSSLNYDATSDQYIYVWKTDKTWAGTCRQLRVKLADGTLHAANFKLTK